MRLWLGVGVLVAVACVLVLPAASAVGGASSPAALSVPSAATVDHPGAITPRGGTPGLDSRLGALAAVSRTQGAAAATTRAQKIGLAVEPGGVRVVVTGTSAAVAAAAVRAVGGTVEVGAGSGVQALVPSQSLRAVAQAPGVRKVAPPARPVPLAVAGEEVGSTGAAGWQTAGVTGAGVKVAIIDVGFVGLASAQATGDVPASVLTQDDCAGGFSTVTQHGTAVAEIVHELAPSAQLLLACVDTPADLATAEQWAVAQGAQIINHSVAWFDTARGDGQGGAGTPDAVVADAAAHGVLWVNAAGNFAQQHWSGTFTPITDSNNLTWENFSGGDLGQSVFVPAGFLFCAFLRWDEWVPTPPDDYDIFIYLAGGTSPVAGSINDQTSGAPPTEEACYTAPADGTYFVAINRFAGGGSPRLDLWTVNAGNAQYQVANGSVTDPAASSSAFAVGAGCWQSGGLEPFSSEGPTIDGRVKPDLAAADRMSSFTYGSFDSCGGVGGFAGTSASSPTVAGMAALVKQLYPSDTAAQLRAYLTSQAIDQGPPGLDSQYGAGRAQLPVVHAPQPVTPPAITGFPTPGHTLTGTQGTWTGDGESFTYAYQWQRCDTTGLNCGSATAGSTYDVTAADLGSRLRLQVTATSLIGSTNAIALTRVIGTTAPPINTLSPSIQGTYYVGQTLTAVEGGWDSPTTPVFTYDWESCDLTTCTPVGTAKTYALGTSDLGHGIKLTVTATNADGLASASTGPGPLVQQQPSGGGGGGGGGGGTSVPDLGVTLAAKLPSIAPGGDDEITVFVRNAGGAGSLQTHLVISLPASITLLGPPAVERGSGCTGTQSVDCFLDYIPNGETTKVIFELRASSAGAQVITATASSDREANPADNAASLTLQVGTTSAPPPPPKPPAPRPHGKTFNGTARADRLVGTPYNDVLYGRGGNDTLLGGKGNDRLFGGLGNDLIRTQDKQRDTIDCGPGRDTVYADRIDTVARNCEVVHRA